MATPTASVDDVLGVAKKRRGEQVIKGLLFLAALLSVVTTAGIVFSLLEETISFFGDVGLGEFLGGTEWFPLFSEPSFGVLPLITGTLLVSGVALLVAVPIGLGAAIYLAEYASGRVRSVLSQDGCSRDS